jgi:hypothetical protein
MNFDDLLGKATDKSSFETIQGYIDFAGSFIEFTKDNLQARIVSRNEPHYQFFQYGSYASYQVTRPINTHLMCGPNEFQAQCCMFTDVLGALSCGITPEQESRQAINRLVYTLQQAIGATFDGLPAGRSNRARKLNGDLFENLIQLVLNQIGLSCVSGTLQVPVQIGVQADPDTDFLMSFQQDLIIKEGKTVQMIGSVKTSSKDRLAKIFIDKFLFGRLTGTQIPHIAIFLHDVQRKGSSLDRLGINPTFLPGHFKAFTVKLTPLDGVYYCDLRPNMKTDELLCNHIHLLDQLVCEDIWRYRRGLFSDNHNYHM